MNDTTAANRAIHKYMGKCWHEFDTRRSLVCQICNNALVFDWEAPNYFTDIVASREFALKVAEKNPGLLDLMIDVQVNGPCLTRHQGKWWANIQRVLISPYDLTLAAARAAGIKEVEGLKDEI